MVARKVLGLFLVSTSAWFAITGCAGEAVSEDDDTIGDSVSSEDEMVAERQLNGRDLPEKTLSLTFDDGPGERTSELADFLAEKGIKGAFFINGSKVPGRQGSIDKIVGRGHLLANHTQNHKQLTSLSGAGIVKEIADTDAIIADAQPNGPWVVRAPFGAWNGNVARAINGTAMRKYVGSVFWDQGGALTDSAAADWACWGQGVSVQRCGELYLNEIRAKKRGVVLLHDIHNKTVEMVKTVIVPALIAEGYKFVGVQDVPSVKSAIQSAGNGGAQQPSDDQCPSATLGRPVGENVCVQSKSNERWSRCVDGEWIGSSADDPRCTERHPLSL